MARNASQRISSLPRIPFLLSQQDRPLICSCISGSCIDAVTSGREGSADKLSHPPSGTNGRVRSHSRARALLRLQRRKHNLIIMYGHISRMSPCLGQCTRGCCGVSTRDSGRGVRLRGYSWRIKRTWGPSAPSRVPPRSSRPNLRDLARCTRSCRGPRLRISPTRTDPLILILLSDAGTAIRFANLRRNDSRD